MWRKICESPNVGISEIDVRKELWDIYKRFEIIHSRLTKSPNIELRKKYIRPIVDFLNWMDYDL